jgi:hypothetical protein
MAKIQKVTKKNVIKAVKEATGIDVEFYKFDGEYYWGGKESCLFVTANTNYSTLTHPNITVETFVNNYKEHIDLTEHYYNKPIKEIVESIDWNIE